MKTSFKIFLTVALALAVSLPIYTHAQVSTNFWKVVSSVLQPIISTWSLKVPQLGGSGTRCLQVDNNGLFAVAAGACGSGSGTFSWTPTSWGVSTSTTLGFLNGFLSTASSTINSNLTITGNSTTTSATTTNFYNSTATNLSNSLYINSSGGNVGIGTTSPYAKLSVVGETVASHFTATTTSTSTLPRLESTGLNLTNWLTFNGVTSATWAGFCSTITGGAGLCDGDDATGAGGSFPFTPDTYTGQVVNATSTGLWLKGSPLGLIASTTFATFSTTTNATTTNFFSTVASTTNLFGANLTTCDATTGKLTWASGLFGCGTDFNTGGGGSDPFTHPSVGLSATTTQLLVGTSTASNYQLTIASSTAPQLSLSASGGFAQWIMRNAGGLFYLATTTTAGTATSSVSALSINTNGIPTFPSLGTGFVKSTAGLFSVGTVDISGDTNLTAGTGITLTGDDLSVDSSQSIATLSNLTTNGFVTTGGGVGTLSVTVPGTNVSTFITTPTTANFLAAVTGETGTGAVVFDTTPTFTTSALFPLGSVSSPGIAFTGDTNTGIWSSGANLINFSADGKEMMRIDGNLDIGTTTDSGLASLFIASSTASQLFLSSGAGFAQWGVRNAGGNLYFSTSTVAGTSTTTTAALTLTGAGKPGLSIGSTTPIATLAVNPVAGNFANQFVIGSSTATSLLLNNAGELFLPRLQTDAAAHTYTMCGEATTFEAVWDTTTCVLSALKYKENINDLDIGLKELLKVRPVSFNWKPTGDPTYDNDINTKHKQIGIIANEIEKVDSRLVTYDNQGEIKGFRYDFFTAWLTKSIQEMWSEVVNLIDWNKDQERRIKALETENELLKVRLEKLENER